MGELVPCDNELALDPTDNGSFTDSDCSEQNSRELEPASDPTFGKVTVKSSKDVHLGPKFVFVLNNSSGKEVSRIIESAQDLDFKNPSACGALFSRTISNNNGHDSNSNKGKRCYSIVFIAVLVIVALTSILFVSLFSDIFSKNDDVPEYSSNGFSVSAALEDTTVTSSVTQWQSISVYSQIYNRTEEMSLTTTKITVVSEATTPSQILKTTYTKPTSKVGSSTTPSDEANVSLVTVSKSSSFDRSSEPSTTPLISLDTTSTITDTTSTSAPTESSTTSYNKLETTPLASTTSQPTLCYAYGADHYFPLIKKAFLIDVSTVSDGICLVSPDQWGSEPCGKYCIAASTLDLVTVHFLETCQTFDTCSALLKSYENNFNPMSDDKQTNFLFNFVVGADSRIYEGLGWTSLVARDNSFHIGVQFWDTSYNFSTKQMYLIMLLFSAGRWCGKIRTGFTLSLVGNKEATRYFNSQRYFRLLNEDKYLLNNEDMFVKDLQYLGAKFSVCDGQPFQHFFTVCPDELC